MEIEIEPPNQCAAIGRWGRGEFLGSELGPHKQVDWILLGLQLRV